MNYDFFSRIPPDAVLWFAIAVLAVTGALLSFIWFFINRPDYELSQRESESADLWSHRSGVGK